MDRGLIYRCLSLSSSKKLQLISELQELVDNYIQGFSLQPELRFTADVKTRLVAQSIPPTLCAQTYIKHEIFEIS